MKASKIRLLQLISGITFLLGGCMFLVFSCMLICKNYLNHTFDTADITIAILCILISLTLFVISADSFIKYGMAKGVDYSLEQKYHIDLK